MIAVMKFQSVIAAIMHGYRIAASAALACLAMASVGCVSLIASKHTYNASSPAVNVGGASVRMQVRPEGDGGGSYALSAMVVSAAVATLDGPFSWRIEATGDPGRQSHLVVHRVRMRTGKTHRDEWFPAKLLGRRADFKSLKESPWKSRAVYPIPGLLAVKPREDGDLTVDVDLTVVSGGRADRKLVRFRMNPAQGRRDEFIFVPAEIVNSIGKPLEETDERGWD
jgi:hypothetical protein